MSDWPQAPALFAALGRLPAREAQRLSFCVVEGRSVASCAALYGVDEVAFGVGLFRAARLFEQALQAPGGGPLLPTAVPPMEPASERAAAQELQRALEDLSAPASPLAALLRRARELGPQLRALAAARQQEYEASPAARRADWLRRLALLALLAGAAYYWLRGS